MLSDHAARIAPSATLAMTIRVAQRLRAGDDIISLNVGEPDFGTPEHICAAAVRAIGAQKTKYTPVSGIAELREAICQKLLRDNGVARTPDEIAVCNGAKQALFGAVFALCGAGDEVIVPTPCWVSYLEMVRLADATPIPVPCREEDGFALDIDAIARAVTPRTKAIIINTPNNPTGAVYSEASLRALCALCARHDLMLISDEVYEKLVYDDAHHVCPASLSEDARARTVVINGLSKAYAMTGWRIGYAAADRRIIAAMNAAQGHMTSNACTISQYAALAALTGSQDCVEQMRQEFARRRLLLRDALCAIPGIRCGNAQGAFYLLANASSYYGKHRADGQPIADSFALADYLLDEAGVAVVPGAAFAAPAHLRIAYANSAENLRRGAARIAAALEKLQ